MKVVQIVNNTVTWVTEHSTVAETVERYPKSCLFVAAPDYVFENWGYRVEDDDGNPIDGDDRFVKPTPPEGYIYNDYTGEFIPEDQAHVVLARAQSEKQEANKIAFAEFLASHPITWVDGKVYGVTIEDQSEISLNLNQYQMQIAAGVSNPTLEWHASKEACTPWTVESLTALALDISAFVYPWFQRMNAYKSAIYASTTKDEVDAIDLVYKTEEELSLETED